jgi:hypothetical protein
MYLINQNLNEIIQKKKPLHVKMHFYDGKLYGWNLYHSKDLLGTFDAEDEANAERDRINNSTASYEIVKGYCRCDEFESLYEAISGGIRLDMTEQQFMEVMNSALAD